MTRRRRTARRHVAGEFGDLFLTSDGVHVAFDAHDDDAYESPFRARAAWNGVARGRTWALWLEEQHFHGVYPPVGAVAYDNLTEYAARLGWPAKTLDASAVSAAVAADLAAVARFRVVNPAAAAEAGAGLKAFEDALRLRAELARTSSVKTNNRKERA